MLTREDKIKFVDDKCNNEKDGCEKCPINHLDCCSRTVIKDFTDEELDKCIMFFKLQDGTLKLKDENDEIVIHTEQLAEVAKYKILNDRTFVRSILYGLIDMIDYYNRITKLPDCNDCGKRSVCRYAPDAGDYVRINCPLWSEEKQNDN